MTGWTIVEDKMKEKGIYIVAHHPKFGGFIIIHSDRDDKESIEEMKQNLIEICEKT